MTKQEDIQKRPFHVFCYDVLMAKQGLKRDVDGKMFKIIHSLMYYKGNDIRIEMAAFFMGLMSKYD